MTRFRTERAVTALAAQFVPIKVDTGGTPEWGRVARKYKYEGNGIPILMVIRADGKQLYGRSGSPAQLAAFLAGHLKQSGNLLDDRKRGEIAAAVKSAKENIEAKNMDPVIDAIVRHAGSGSFDEASVTMDALAEEVTKEAVAAINEADAELQKRETMWDGALAFAQLERTYRRLPGVSNLLTEKQRDYRKDATMRDQVELARLLDRAQTYAEEEKFRQAATLFESIVKDYPDTPAAKTAAEELPKLAGKAEPQSDADERRALSQLRLGKQLLKRKPEIAQEYFERVIKLAPNSEAAKEAKKLLK